MAQETGQPQPNFWIRLTVPFRRKAHFRKKYGKQFYWDKVFRCWAWVSQQELPKDLKFYVHPYFLPKPRDWEWPLKIGLVPRSCWLRNVRRFVSDRKWREIRLSVLNVANEACETCSSRDWVECHEVFEYDYKTKTQRLIGLQALCYACHSVKHFGRGGRKDKADMLAHICKINGWSLEAATSHMRKQFRVYEQRSEEAWVKMDFSYLKKHFNTRVRQETPAQRRKRLKEIKQIGALKQERMKKDQVQPVMQPSVV